MSNATLARETIHLFYDEVKIEGHHQYRVSAVCCGTLIHTVIRWSQMSAKFEMQRWITKNIKMIDQTQASN